MQSVQNELDLERLDDYLSSDESPDNCMMLSDLDGFLHGLVCSPVPISPEEWMSFALGSSLEGIPNWVLDGLLKQHQSIVMGLSAKQPFIEPIFWEASNGHLVAMDWCEGFMEAVGLRQSEWQRLIESGKDGSLMIPIMIHILDQNGKSVLGVPQEELGVLLDQAVSEIAMSVYKIYAFWHSKLS